MQRIPQYLIITAIGIMLFGGSGIFCCLGFADTNNFTFVTPQPTGNEIHDTWSADGQTFFFVGDGGTILKYSGGTWETMETPTNSPLYGIHGTSTTDIWAVGGDAYSETDAEESVILHFDGTSWTSVIPPDYLGDFHVMRDVFAAGPNDVWGIATFSSYLCHYDGSSWQFVDTGITSTLPYDFYAIHGFSANDIYVVGACNTILHYNGLTWSKEYQSENTHCPDMVFNMLYDVWGTASDSVFTCGNNNQILTRQNTTPVTWTMIHDPNGMFDAVNLNGIGGTLGDGMYFVGNGGVIWKYAGAAFTTVATGGTSTLNTIIPKSTGGYIVAGGNGIVNGFDGTSQVPLNQPVSLHKDFMYDTFNGDRLWISPLYLSDAQGVYIYNGKNFSEQALSFGDGNQATVTCFKSVAEDDIWLGTQVDQAAIKRYNGSTWTDYPVPGRADHPILRDVLKSSSGSYFVILGDSSGQQQPCKVLETSTECYNDPVGYTMYNALAEDDDTGTIYAAGAGGVIASYSNGAWSKETSGTEEDLVGIAAGGGWIYAVGANRTIIFKQSGQAWQAINGLTTRDGNSFRDVVYAGNGISYTTLQTPTQYIGGGKGYIYALQNGVATSKIGSSSMSFNDLASNKAGRVMVVGNSGMVFGIGGFPSPTLGDAIKILQILTKTTPAEPGYFDMTENNKADLGDVITLLTTLSKQ